jgi:RNA polymerase sigma-70 factor (ECF subfamily)
MAGGDSKAALSDFYDRYSGIVMAVVLRILGSRAEAEELLQEVFIELWRRAPDYDTGRGAVTTWVVTIARSRALDALRARKRRGGDKHVPVEDTPMPAPAHQRPDEKAALSQRGEAVRTALGSLSEVQRTALELSYFSGLSHREIAEHLQIPVGTVKSRIIAAMKILRGTLATVI